MTDVFNQLWADFAAGSLGGDLRPRERAIGERSYAAGGWAVYAILAQLEADGLSADLRGQALDRLRAAIVEFSEGQTQEVEGSIKPR